MVWYVKLEVVHILGSYPKAYLRVSDIHYVSKNWAVNKVGCEKTCKDYIQGTPKLNLIGGCLVMYGVINTTVVLVINQVLPPPLLRYKAHWDDPEVGDVGHYAEDQNNYIPTSCLIRNLTVEEVSSPERQYITSVADLPEPFCGRHV